jgi:two-component system response regulator RegA
MSAIYPSRILVCDDDGAFRRRLARSLRDRELQVFEADSARSGLSVVRLYKPDGAIVDLKMADEGGLWLVKEIANINPECKVVVLTGFGSIATALEALRRGAINYITKPAKLDQILDAFLVKDRESLSAENSSFEMPSLAEVQQEYVQRVLDQCNGNVSRSAKVLGVHRRSLQRRLRR